MPSVTAHKIAPTCARTDQPTGSVGKQCITNPECPVPFSRRLRDRDGGEVSAEVEDAAHGDVKAVYLTKPFKTR